MSILVFMLLSILYQLIYNKILLTIQKHWEIGLFINQQQQTTNNRQQRQNELNPQIIQHYHGRVTQNNFYGNHKYRRWYGITRNY